MILASRWTSAVALLLLLANPASCQTMSEPALGNTTDAPESPATGTAAPPVVDGTPLVNGTNANATAAAPVPDPEQTEVDQNATIPEAPEVPEVPEVPGTPESPGQTNATDPEIPEQVNSTVPEVPEAPEVPQVNSTATENTTNTTNTTNPVDPTSPSDPAVEAVVLTNTTDTTGGESVLEPTSPAVNNTTNGTAATPPSSTCVDDVNFNQFDMLCQDFAGEDCIEYYRQKPNDTVSVSTTSSPPAVSHTHSFQNTVDLIHSCPASCQIPCDRFHAFDTRVSMVLTYLSVVGHPREEHWPIDKPSQIRMEELAYEFVRDRYGRTPMNSTLSLYLGLASLMDQKVWVPGHHNRHGHRLRHLETQHHSGSNHVRSRQSAQVTLQFKGFTIGPTPNGFHIGKFIADQLLGRDFTKADVTYAMHLQTSGGPTFAQVEIPGTPEEMESKHGSLGPRVSAPKPKSSSSDSSGDFHLWKVAVPLTLVCVGAAFFIKRKLWNSRHRFAVVAAEQHVTTVPAGYSGMIT